MRSQQITITRSAHCAVWEHRHGGLHEAGEYLYDRKAVRVAVNLRTHTGTRRGVVVLTNQMKAYANPVGWTLIQGMPFTRQNTVYAVRQQIGVGVWLKKTGPASDLHIIKMLPDSPAGEAGHTDEMVITQIGESLVDGKDLEECNALLSCEADTIVRLTLCGADVRDRAVDLSRRSFLTNS